MAKTQTTVSDEPEATDAELYGDVKPTMINGVFVGEEKPTKPAPTLAEQIAGAFPNQAQIDAVLAVLAVASGKAPADETTVGALSPDVDERLKLLEQHAETVDDHLQESDARALTAENRLTALENPKLVTAPSET